MVKSLENYRSCTQSYAQPRDNSATECSTEFTWNLCTSPLALRGDKAEVHQMLGFMSSPPQIFNFPDRVLIVIHSRTNRSSLTTPSIEIGEAQLGGKFQPRRTDYISLNMRYSPHPHNPFTSSVVTLDLAISWSPCIHSLGSPFIQGPIRFVEALRIDSQKGACTEIAIDNWIREAFDNESRYNFPAHCQASRAPWDVEKTSSEPFAAL